MIKVLVVDDSPVVREYLVHILESDPAIEVTGTAMDGSEAVKLAGKLRPDVITMDINMPVMNGLEATGRIMETCPAPIVIVSGIWDPKEVETTFRAIEAGALAIVQRPAGIGHPQGERMKEELISKVKLMSEVKVVRRWVRPRQAVEAKPAAGSLPSLRIRPDIDVVAIGASTGGPVALRTILSGLQPDFQVPVLIVQHIAAGFIRGMVEWLSGTSGLRLHVAEEGDKLQRSHAYFAPDGVDMGVDKSQHIRLRSDGRSVTTPSVSHLFRSVAEAYGENAAGVLLTGMGKDGAEELKLMKEKGALTVAQDRESSVVFGMPGEAIRINAAACVLPPHEIALMLGRLGASRATRPEAG